METTCSSETSVDFQRTTRRYIQKKELFNVKMDRKETDYGDLDWIYVDQNTELLWTRYWIFLFRKRRAISWLVERLLASKEGLYPMKWMG
jgi:hypothetical protein